MDFVGEGVTELKNDSKSSAEGSFRLSLSEEKSEPALEEADVFPDLDELTDSFGFIGSFSGIDCCFGGMFFMGFNGERRSAAEALFGETVDMELDFGFEAGFL